MKKIFVLLLATILIISCAEKKASVEQSNILTKALSSSDTNFLKAVEPRKFEFPTDYFAHNRYKVEWWYFTGNLESEDGHQFGYQFTIFRNALSSDSLSNKSGFNTNQMYFAHFTISDITGNKFYFDDKTSREANKISGCDTSQSLIFIDDWNIKMEFPDNDPDSPIFLINAVSKDKSVNLKLKPLKKMVLHGDNGLSQKSGDPGNASYYYSFTRLETEGTLFVAGKSYPVHGLSWHDREWSTSALKPNQSGWDWFSLQFDDGTDIMLYKIRDTSGNADYSVGTYVDKIGDKTNLSAQDFSITNTGYYSAPDGSRYPSSWQIKLKRNGMVIEVSTRIKDQIVKGFLKYYEGAVEVKFKGSGTIGKGYVELTGY